jgi:hypothetical protein
MSPERAVILTLLRDDHDVRWTRDELSHEVGFEVRPHLCGLVVDGLVVLDGQGVLASRCVRRMDALGLVGV